MLKARKCVESMPIRSWNYRAIEFVMEDGAVWRSIHEVHYIDEAPMSYSDLPAAVMWEQNDGELPRFCPLGSCVKRCASQFWKRSISPLTSPPVIDS